MPNMVNKDRKARSLACISFLVLLAIFVLSRAVFLDRDLPPGIISSYVQIDELYYTIPAFNLYHYGETNHKIVPFIEDQNTPVNVMENVATFGSLRLFGNNYYGLRMASVFPALFIFILLYLILKKILNGNLEPGEQDPAADRGLKRRYILYFLLAYILCDFSFLVAGRVAEPTIFRMLALMIVIYLGSLSVFAQPLESKWYSMLLGFLALVSVVFVYIYNAFIFFALAVTVFMWAYKAGRKNALKKGAFFLLGSLLGLLSYQVFAQVVYHSSLLEVYHTLIPFQSRMGVGESQTSAFVFYMTNIFTLFITNLFRFNIIILFIFMVSLPVFVKKVINERTNFDILIFNLILFFIMQTLVINDYPLRKLIILLPLIIIFVTSSYTYSARYLMEIKSTSSGRAIMICYWILAWLFTLVVASIYLFPQVSGAAALATGNLTYLNWGVFLVVSLTMILNYISEIRIKPIGMVICLLLILLPNLFLDGKYVFLNRTYYFRDTMIAMSDKVDGKIIAGGCAYGFRLYNKSIPVLNFYTTSYSYDKNQVELYHQNFDQVFASNLASYSIAFTPGDPKTAASEDYMNEHGLQLEDEYKVYNLLDGNVGLFASKPKPDQ
jgi:hypothetical protein